MEEHKKFENRNKCLEHKYFEWPGKALNLNLVFELQFKNAQFSKLRLHSGIFTILELSEKNFNLNRHNDT